MNEKYNAFIEYLKTFNSLAVAYSGGVDSTFLLYAAKEALGHKVIAVTAKSYLFPGRETEETITFCKENNIRQIIIEPKELEIEGFEKNPKNRCYICKKDLFSKMLQMAEREHIDYVVEGSNTDDDSDYRPGMQAIAELGIKSPLRYVGFSKQEIREISKELNLKTFNKPSYACLASRFAYGEIIDEKKLGMVDRAEQLLLDMGFSQFRVRIHGKLARIELMPEEFDKFMKENIRNKVYEELKKIGFIYVSLDIKGYRTGSMNEI